MYLRIFIILSFYRLYLMENPSINVKPTPILSYFLFTQWKTIACSIFRLLKRSKCIQSLYVYPFPFIFLWFSLWLYMQTSRMCHLNDTLLFLLWAIMKSTDALFCWYGFSTTTVQSHSVCWCACMFSTCCCFPLSHHHSWCTILHLLRICFVKK